MSLVAVDQILKLPEQEMASVLAQKPEDQWFERKSARIAAKDLAKSLVAMANADGGVVVVGIHAGKLENLDINRRNTIRQTAIDFTQPPVRIRPQEITLSTTDGTQVTLLVLFVSPGEQVHLTQNGDCYLRVGDESRRLTANQQRELEYDRGSSHYEATAAQIELAQLNQEKLQSYATLLGVSDAESALVARDLVDRQNRITVAAELLFADRPQQEFPSAVVRILKYGSDQRGTGSSMTLLEGGDIRVEGPLPDQLHEAQEVISAMMPKWQQLGPQGLFEPASRIPRDAWLEGLVNAVVHRSYSMMGDHIRFEIFPNRIEITSPGRFPGVVNPDRPLEIRRYARNPRIARVMAELGFTRELGEGIRRLFAEMRENGLADPLYEQSSSAVKLTLSALDAIPPEVRKRLTPSALSVLTALRQAGKPVGTGDVADMAEVTRQTAIRALTQLKDEGLVSWQGHSKRDPRATWSLGTS